MNRLFRAVAAAAVFALVYPQAAQAGNFVTAPGLTTVVSTMSPGVSAYLEDFAADSVVIDVSTCNTLTIVFDSDIATAADNGDTVIRPEWCAATVAAGASVSCKAIFSSDLDNGTTADAGYDMVAPSGAFRVNVITPPGVGTPRAVLVCK